MDIYVQSFLNSATKLTISVNNTTTFAQLAGLVSTAEGTTSTIMQFYVGGVLASSTATMSTYSVTTGTYVGSSNVISTLTNKTDRQLAKLEIAQLRRQAGGNTATNYYRTYNVYDIDLLADKYTSNTTTVGTTSTLAVHRPWIAAPSLVTANLILNLDPDNSSSYSGSGATWTDLAGTAQNLTLYGSPTYTSGTPSYFTFNGTTQYALSASTGIVNTTAYTKSAWFYLNAYQDNNIFSGDGHFIYMGPSASVDRKIYSGHSDWPSFTAYASSATINLNTWYNVTLTFSTASGMSLYINGALDSTYTVRKTAHPGTGSASVASYVAGNFLNGRVGKVLCYNVELSAAQVLQNYNSTKSTYGL